MPAFTDTEAFLAECAERLIDYDRLFEPRVTPEWLLRWEQQVLAECRKELAELDLPTAAEFDRRVAIMDAEQAASGLPRNDQAPEPLRSFLSATGSRAPA